MGLTAKKPYKIVTLDSRYAGSEHFKYMIDCRGNQRDELIFNFRRWFWDTYGPSSEYRMWAPMAARNQMLVSKNLPVLMEVSMLWSWETEHNRARFYVRDDETLSNFILHH